MYILQQFGLCMLVSENCDFSLFWGFNLFWLKQTYPDIATQEPIETWETRQYVGNWQGSIKSGAP